ncbi:MAG: recombinase RecF [Idiomarinaceae bacterium]|nr:recombinase RecF [Idiomarinaceae bacterium]|tara:strand:+ start:358 stop:1995 length:1638 start_codon:yes stop_codon:yes gene_type:complete
MSQERKTSRVLKFERDSKNGDFSASYQLSVMYRDGISVESDDSIANHYESLCAKQVESECLRIASIRLVNFKGFKDLELELPHESGVTVLVGNNGSGKSTVLEGIKKCFTHAVSRITTQSKNGDAIEDIEIRHGSPHASIMLEFELGGKLFASSLSKSRALSTSKLKSDFKELNDLCEILKISASSSQSSPLPLLASYTVDRSIDVSTKDIDASKEFNESYEWNRASGYHKSLTGKSDFRLFFRWFQEQAADESFSNADIRSLKNQLLSKKTDLESPFINELMSSEDSRKIGQRLIDDLQGQIAELEAKLNVYLSSENLNRRLLTFVEQAIYTFLPGFKALRVKRSPPDMTLVKDGVELSVLQLSQGEKSVLALVADIARRLTLLNPQSSSPLKGCGVVLIDEIDLHLHPGWQQQVVPRLRSTFPNIQFIVTTHSPQVCHTVDSEHIWLLTDGRKFQAPKGTRGGVSSWVLENLFDVSPRPPGDEYTQKLREYKTLVFEDKYDTPQAERLRGELRNHFGEAYDVLVELDLVIENKRWERSLEEGK